MHMRTSLLGGGVAMLLIGIALWVYGYNVEPTTGQAIGNIFSGNFTDKRNAFMFVGLIVGAAGGAGVLVGAMTGSRALRT